MDSCLVGEESTASENRTPDLTWKDILSFGNDSEFECLVEVEGSNKVKTKNQTVMHNLKQKFLAFHFNTDTDDVSICEHEVNLLSSALSKASSPETVQSNDALFYLDPDNMSRLLAIRKTSESVCYSSHCSETDFCQLNSDKPDEIFNFDNIFEELTSEDNIIADPSNATMIFKSKKNKEVRVTITSKAANGLVACCA